MISLKKLSQPNLRTHPQCPLPSYLKKHAFISNTTQSRKSSPLASTSNCSTAVFAQKFYFFTKIRSFLVFLCVFKEKRSKNEFFRKSLKTFLETHSSSSFHTSFVTPKVLLAPRKHYPQQLFIERFFRARRACLSI